MARYGIGAAGANPWYRGDPRFDLAVNPNEPNRFGWVVEIDPADPDWTPKKRTALGRLKHENAAFAEADDGRAVVYTGDDERFQFLYKYVSNQPWRRYRRGASPLDDGTLFVARFDADGTGVWLPLVAGASRLRDAGGHPDRHPTARPRPSGRRRWTAPSGSPRIPSSPASPTARSPTTPTAPRPTQPNPRPNNAFGHILRWQGAGGDHAADTFVWSVFALAGKGLGTGDGSTVSPGDAFGSPDGLAFDPDGRLWIETDGSQPVPCNNQLLAADPTTGDIRRFLVGPKGCEITGWTMTDDQRTMFVNVQHPGEARHRSGQPGVTVELAGLPGSSALGDARHPPPRRRQDRDLTQPAICQSSCRTLFDDLRQPAQ